MDKKKIAIFGAGSASLITIYGVNTDNCEIVKVIDNDKTKWGKEWLGYVVDPVESVLETEFDEIIISHIYGESATKQLVEMGIPENKISDFYGRKETLFEVRIPTLYACMEEIKRRNVSGNLAELGVFQGDFSKHFSKAFPERKLYLFDTFEGFDDKDISKEEVEASNPQKHEFTKTSIELVLLKMSNKENVVVRKGYFPETAEGLEDTFALVSIDPDLYLPVLNGLKYFWPRLSKGGYIFVHDYNNRRFSGVKKAVDEFMSENDIKIVPICDVGGSIIITK